MKKFAVELKQALIVEAGSEEEAKAAVLEAIPHVDSTTFGEGAPRSVQSTRKVEILTCKPFKGRKARLTGSYR